MTWNNKGICTFPRCQCKATGVYCSKRKSGDERKRKSIPRRSLKGQLRAEDKKTLTISDMVLYLEIWEERPHICFECGKSLGSQPLMQFFHHVLEKGSPRFAHLRHEKMNIVLLDWAHHDDVPTNLDKLPKLEAYRKKLLKHFKLE